MILTIVLLLMCGAGIGIVSWMHRISQSQTYIEYVVNNLRIQIEGLAQAERKRQDELIGYVLRDGKKTWKDIQEVKTRLSWSHKRETKDLKEES